jgi:peptidoglycan/LPS O-acetylase OafA/YrhL
MLFAGVYGVLFNGDSGYNTSLWMMQIEFFGSFLTFGFLALFGRLSRRYIWYVTGLIVLFNTYYLAFLLGIILCDYSKFLNSAKYHEWYVRLSMISVCIVGVILSAYPIMAGETGILPLYFAFSFLSSVQAIISAHILGAFLLLLALFYFPFLQGLFRIRILLFLGSISFSLYLLHALILGSLSSYLFLVFNSHFSYFVSVMLMIVLSVPVLLGSAYLYSRYIDSFAQRIALWFYAHFFSS